MNHKNLKLKEKPRIFSFSIKVKVNKLYKKIVMEEIDIYQFSQIVKSIYSI